MCLDQMLLLGVEVVVPPSSESAKELHSTPHEQIDKAVVVRMLLLKPTDKHTGGVVVLLVDSYEDAQQKVDHHRGMDA